MRRRDDGYQRSLVISYVSYSLSIAAISCLYAAVSHSSGSVNGSFVLVNFQPDYKITKPVMEKNKDCRTSDRGKHQPRILSDIATLCAIAAFPHQTNNTAGFIYIMREPGSGVNRPDQQHRARESCNQWTARLLMVFSPNPAEYAIIIQGLHDGEGDDVRLDVVFRER